MKTVKKRIGLLLLFWLLAVPPGLFFAFTYFPPGDLNIGYIIAFIVFAVMMTLFPLQMNGHSIFVVQWVTYAVFLKYGLFAEMVALQLSALIVVLRTTSTEPRAARILFNSIMFFFTSLTAGFAFYALGGQTGSLSITHIILYGLLFQFAHFVANNLILYIYAKLLKEEIRFFSSDFLWDLSLMSVIFPFTIVIYLLEAYIGVGAVLLLAVPFVFISFFLRLYNNSEQINKDLKKASEIGRELAGSMTKEEVFDLFMLKITEMMPVDYAYLLDCENGGFELIRHIENGRFRKTDLSSVEPPAELARRVLAFNRALIYSQKKEWSGAVGIRLPMDAESVMALPISRNGQTEGVLILAARKKRTFAAHQLKLLEMLSSYFAVSLQKAEFVQHAIAKSERCGLTQLYNYRFLDDQLERSMKKVNEGTLRELSLIMMDIDHFKAINDQYGHQSGNEILKALARIIESEVKMAGIVARYGGEEFVILLPEFKKDAALVLAEQIRKRIETTKFIIQSDLDDHRSVYTVQITMSIGISTAPQDSDEGMALIRNADRALYVGAKQAGRNRVAAYAR